MTNHLGMFTNDFGILDCIMFPLMGFPNCFGPFILFWYQVLWFDLEIISVMPPVRDWNPCGFVYLQNSIYIFQFIIYDLTLL